MRRLERKQRLAQRWLLVFTWFYVWPIGVAHSIDEGNNGPTGGAREITLEDYARLNQISPARPEAVDRTSFALSPDGKRIAYQLYQGHAGTNSFSVGWYIAAVEPHAKSLFAGDGGDVALRPGVGERIAIAMAKWSPDGLWIAYLAKKSGQVQLWRSRSDTGAQEQLTHGPSDVLSFEWSPDGGSIYFAAASRTRDEVTKMEDAESRQGYLLDSRFDFRSGTRPPGPPATVGRRWVLDLSSLSVRPFTKTDAPPPNDIEVKLVQAAALPTAKGFGWSKPVANLRTRQVAFADEILPLDQQTDPTSVVSVTKVGAPNGKKACTHPRCRGIIRNLWWSNDGSHVYFEKGNQNYGTYSEYYAWEVGTNRVSKLFSTTAWLDGCAVSTLAGNDGFLCHSETIEAPGSIVAIAFSSGAVTSVVDPNPWFREIQLTKVERLSWTTDIGDGIIDHAVGYLITPRGYIKGRRYPLVVLLKQAFGFLQPFGGGQEYPAHFLAQKGFMVFICNKPNDALNKLGTFRGFQNDFQERRHSLASLEGALDSLEGRGLIDRNKVALTGFSDGETIALWALLHSRRHFATAIFSQDGTDSFAHYLYPKPVRDSVAQQGGITFDKTGPVSWYYDASGFAKNVEKIIQPLLFELSDSEVLEGLQGLVTLDHYNKPIESYVYPNERHMKWQPAHLYSIWRRNTEWLEFWLLGREVEDPVDPEQYIRWRKLKSSSKTPAQSASAISP